LIRQKHGDNPRPVIAIQAERAIKRLEAFAAWQAHWAMEHEIIDIELVFNEDHHSLDVDGRAMGLRGRIDRIDRNRRTNELIILDYKTSNLSDPKQHRSRGEWVDFQLPLYYHLLGQRTKYVELLRHHFRLGYILLPSNVEKTGGVFADWNREEVLLAIDEARNIVRSIWNNEFDMITPAPRYSEAFAAICHDF
jgi:hypothetical protein